MIQTTTVMVNSNNVEMKININTASREELKTLQGVGEYKADLIILNRSYSNIYDLLDRDIIGEDLFNSIKDKITI
jgi:competence protein ComEA